MKRLLLVAPVLFYLQGCGSANASDPAVDAKEIGIPMPPPTLVYEVLHESQYNEFANATSKGVQVLSDQLQYEAELLKRSSDKVKAVDFKNEQVVLVDMGQKSAGGYSVAVSFTENEKQVKASVVYSAPGQGCMVTTALTNPYQFIKLNTKKVVLVEESLVATPCK